MEMDRKDGTEVILSYTVDVNENSEEGCEMHPFLTLLNPGQTHISKFNCTEMLDSGPKCPGGTRVTPKEMMANGYCEASGAINLCVGTTAGPAGSPVPSGNRKTPIGIWWSNGSPVASEEEAGTDAVLTGCDTPNDGEVGFLEFSACLSSGGINTSERGDAGNGASSRPVGETVGSKAIQDRPKVILSENPARCIKTTTSANRDSSGFKEAAPLETSPDGSYGPLGGNGANLVASAETLAAIWTEGSTLLLKSTDTVKTGQGGTSYEETMVTGTTTTSNRVTPWLTEMVDGHATGTGTSDDNVVVGETVNGGTDANQFTPGATTESRWTHASLTDTVKTPSVKATKANPVVVPSVGENTQLGTDLEIVGLTEIQKWKTVADGTCATGETFCAMESDANVAGNGDAVPLYDEVLPLDQVAGLSSIQDSQEWSKSCARTENASRTGNDGQVPNGEVNSGTVGEQAGQLNLNPVLDKGVRVGNCRLLVINKRPLRDDSSDFGGHVYPIEEIADATRRWALSQDSDQHLEHGSISSTETLDLGVARPRCLWTKPGPTTSLSFGATPLNKEGAGFFTPDADTGDIPDSVNSLDLSRSRSAPEKLQVYDGTEEGQVAKKHGIAGFLTRNLFSWKTRESSAALTASGWKIFGGTGGDSKVLTQESEKGAPPTRRRNLEFEPLSTTGLILEDRPANLPAKSEEEAERHRQEYSEMVAGARRREVKEAQRKKKQMKERYRQEEGIARALVTWNSEILPNWENMRNTRRARELWWQGLPPSIRGKIWSLAIGNELNITPELYEIFLSRAKEKWRSFNETSSLSENDGERNEFETFNSSKREKEITKRPNFDAYRGADKESSLDLIKLDIFRTFPSLYIFQKGGPYHDVLHSVLGAYTCYRPDVGYVQGMSFIAAVLILNLEEADAFITFANLLNKPCQMAFFRVDHDLMLKYFAAFEVFFEENLPKLFQHFQNHRLTPDFYLIDWIFTLYSKPLPLDVACRVWDLFCRDGEEALFRTALGILRLYRDVLLRMDFIHIAQFLSRLPQDTAAQSLFVCIANTHMLSANRRWNQVFSALIKDAPKDADKAGSPAPRS